jgi:hypothetical protein
MLPECTRFLGWFGVRKGTTKAQKIGSKKKSRPYSQTKTAQEISAPPDKDDAVPMVRKADGGKCAGGPVGTTYRMSEGPTIHFDRPRAGTLAPSPPSFPGWARRSVGAEGRACAMGAGGAFKISAPRFRPPDKDDAVPRVRKADGGKCEGGPVGTMYNRR